MKDYVLFLRILADRVLRARLSTGQRILDAGDFKAWLLELADKADNAGTVEEFFAEV